MAEWIAISAIAGGTALSAVNQAQQGREARKLHKQRAAAALEDARAVRKAAGEKARGVRKQAKREKARQRVLFAKEGVSGPTALDIMKITADEFEKEATIFQEGGSVEASRLRGQAEFELEAGQSAFRAGIYGAGATALSGLGTLGLVGAERGLFNRRTPKLTDLQRRRFGAITTRF